MNPFTITAVQTQPSLSNDYRRIVAVKVADTNGVTKTLLLAGIIGAIESGIKVYVSKFGVRVEVRVVMESGIKYIRTVGDFTTMNNLLSLPRF